MSSNPGNQPSLNGVLKNFQSSGEEMLQLDFVENQPAGAESLVIGSWRGWISLGAREKARSLAFSSLDSEGLLAIDGAIWVTPESHFSGSVHNYLRSDICNLGNLRGAFSGVLITKDLVYLFADHIRSKNLFYYFAEDTSTLFFSSDIVQLSATLRANSISIRRCEKGARALLTFGFMLGSETLIGGVKRVSPGSAVIVRADKVDEIEYHRFSNEPASIRKSRHFYVGELQERFSSAVKMAFDWDRRHGYSHLANLSGGLDSRNVVAEAVALGFQEILTCTTSAPSYLDQEIAAKVAAALGVENIFYSLGDGDYLANLTHAVRANGGLVFASGSAHILSMMAHIKTDDRGLLHTGLIGDGVMGTFLRRRGQEHSDPLAGASSRFLFEWAEEVAAPFWSRFPNDEMFKLYTRGFNGVMNGFHSLSSYTTSVSAFLDPDFVSFCLSIPSDIRYGSTGAGIYRDWILLKRHSVSRFRWERTGLSPRVPNPIAKMSMLARGAARRTGIKQWRFSMTPIADWYNTNPLVKRTWVEQFDEKKPLLGDDPEILKAAETLFAHGTPTEKDQVLTLLLAHEVLGIVS